MRLFQVSITARAPLAKADSIPMNHHDLLEGLSPQLTLEFFATFARFEYALKCRSYLQSKNSEKAAKASRKILAEKLGPDFFEEVRSQGKIPTLFAKPPI